jgi:hypothetical protein
MRNFMFVLLILLSPLAFLVPFSNSSPATSMTYTVAERTTTATYTSTALDTSVASTTGNMVVQIPLSIPPKGVGFMAPKGKCSQFIMSVTVKSGTTLNLELTSANPANLYLLPTETYQASANGCDLIGNSLLAENNFTAYTLQWTATENSTVYLLLTGPSTIIILCDHGSTQAVQQLATTTYAITGTNLNVYSSATIANYTQSTTILTSPQFYYLAPQRLGLSLIAFIAAILGSMLILGPKKGFVTLGRLKKMLNGAR